MLYGSKFHRLKQSRGQQGIGISAAGLYAQLTTGKPVTITSKTGKGRPAYRIELRIDAKRNQPDVVKDVTVEWEKEHGTRVELELVAAYRGGRTGVEAYLEQTVVANPHLGLTYHPPQGGDPDLPSRVRPAPARAGGDQAHPHGVELGMFLAMLHDSPGKSVKEVLMDDFSRVSASIAEKICSIAKVKPGVSAAKLFGDDVDRLHKALGEVKVMAPSASCVVPIGEELLVEGLKRRFKADVYISCTRPPLRLSRQSLRGRGGVGLRRGAPARRAGGDHALREPRPAPVPAQGLRDQRIDLPDQLAVVRDLPTQRVAPGRAAGHRGPPRERVGALYQRSEGSGRPLRRPPPGDEAGGAGVRAQAGGLTSAPTRGP